MSGPSTYVPQTGFTRWLDSRLPLVRFAHDTMLTFPTPRNLNFWYAFGAILTFCLGVQIVTGIVLAMHYVPNADMAFDSVENIMRDVNYGWLLRYMHSNGASMFFLAVYVHMFRGLYYGSYKAPREVLWILGVIIYLLMVMTAFMGYVLPWGQMSFWAATVITNLFSSLDQVVPHLGSTIATWLWGDFAVGDATLNRFFSLHYLLPFVIAGVVGLHIWALHVPGNNNPLGIDVKGPQDTLPFHPYYTAKDAFYVGLFAILFAVLVFFAPDFVGNPDNLHSGQSAGDAARHRAGMVPAAVLRDAALHPAEADRRDGAGRRDPDPGLHPLAGHQPRALQPLPPADEAVLLGVRRGLHPARLSRRAVGRRGGLRHRFRWSGSRASAPPITTASSGWSCRSSA